MLTIEFRISERRELGGKQAQCQGNGTKKVQRACCNWSSWNHKSETS
jgi:hypothetical protein